MPRREEPNMLSEEELTFELMNLKSILPKEIYDYLFALLDLEISALSRKDITTEEFTALSDLHAFKELVFYNLVNLAQRYINPKNLMYEEERYTNGLNIIYGDYYTNDSLFGISRFGLGKNEQDATNIRLYNCDAPSFESVLLGYDSKIAELEKIIHDYRYSKFGSIDSYSSSMVKFNNLRKMNYENLVEIHDLLLEISKRQKALYKDFLVDSNIIPSLEQLQVQENYQEVNDGCINVKVYTQKKTSIF